MNLIDKVIEAVFDSDILQCHRGLRSQSKKTHEVSDNKKGKPTATGLDGCRGYLRWLALHHPQTYAALMARVLPYYVNTDLPEEILSRDETLAQLKERGLPIELLQHLQKATQPLDDDEDPDPYRSPDEAVDVTPKKDV
jgi:hypothetical protein